ncbi:hypothetical protein QQG74_14910 [Micromonospora sp. FIMYZ51]|uniref:hypothetical protein n=1 Tax=Micromonospora sp. FIMYZ51 TaxID=3051832 RepID=UPI00311E1D51
MNNQTRGTQARLYYVAGGSVLTRPALSSEGNWNWVPYSSAELPEALAHPHRGRRRPRIRHRPIP